MVITHLNFPLQTLLRSAFLLSSGETKKEKERVVAHGTRHFFLLASSCIGKPITATAPYSETY
jgi:hypothetical protein